MEGNNRLAATHCLEQAAAGKERDSCAAETWFWFCAYVLLMGWIRPGGNKGSMWLMKETKLIFSAAFLRSIVKTSLWKIDRPIQKLAGFYLWARS